MLLIMYHGNKKDQSRNMVLNIVIIHVVISKVKNDYIDYNIVECTFDENYQMTI